MTQFQNVWMKATEKIKGEGRNQGEDNKGHSANPDAEDAPRPISKHSHYLVARRRNLKVLAPQYFGKGGHHLPSTERLVVAGKVLEADLAVWEDKG